MKFPVVKRSSLLQPASGPFIKIQYDQAQAALSRFIHAVIENPDKAWAFVSRVYSAGLNLQELQMVLQADIKYIKGAKYVPRSKNAMIQSLYIQDKNTKARCLLHLHMVNEPDHHSQWKIFGVEQIEWK